MTAKNFTCLDRKSTTIRIILHEETFNDQAGQIEFSRGCANKIEYGEWLKSEKTPSNGIREASQVPKIN